MPETRREGGLGLVVDVVAERLLTGSALMLRGQVGQGLLHMGAGMLAYNFFGLPGVLAVSANSVALAETGSNVLELATRSADARRDAADTPATSTKRG